MHVIDPPLEGLRHVRKRVAEQALDFVAPRNPPCHIPVPQGLAGGAGGQVVALLAAAQRLFEPLARRDVGVRATEHERTAIGARSMRERSSIQITSPEGLIQRYSIWSVSSPSSSAAWAARTRSLSFRVQPVAPERRAAVPHLGWVPGDPLDAPAVEDRYTARHQRVGEVGLVHRLHERLGERAVARLAGPQCVLGAASLLDLFTHPLVEARLTDSGRGERREGVQPALVLGPEGGALRAEQDQCAKRTVLVREWNTQPGPGATGTASARSQIRGSSNRSSDRTAALLRNTSPTRPVPAGWRMPTDATFTPRVATISISPVSGSARAMRAWSAPVSPSAASRTRSQPRAEVELAADRDRRGVQRAQLVRAFVTLGISSVASQ